MSSAGDHAADDGSLARSTGGAAARGAMLIAVALIIGLVLMAFALDDPQSEITSGGSSTDSSDDASDDASDSTSDSSDAGDSADSGDASNGDADVASTQPPETIPDVVDSEGVHPPSEVNVLVANGTGGKGVAGAVADKLKTRGYIANASNAPSAAAAIIYYRVGYADDAREVASILGAPPDIITPAPGDGTIAVAAEAVSDGRLSDANVVVIVGADNAVPPG